MRYNPPQLESRSCIRWLYALDACCGLPVTVCVVCTAPCAPYKVFYVQDSPDWLLPFFNGADPNVPAEHQGVWWMQDNSIAEDFVAIHSSYKPDGTFRLNGYTNWSKRATLGGLGQHLVSYLLNIVQFAEPQADGTVTLKDGMLLRVKALVDKNNDNVAFDPKHDWVRITLLDDAQPELGFVYQYRMRRVAYMDAKNNLITTPAYHEMIQHKKETETMCQCFRSSWTWPVQIANFPTPDQQAMNRA